MSTWIRIILLVMIVAGLAACANSTTPTPQTAASPTPAAVTEKPTPSAALQALNDSFFQAVLKEDWTGAAKGFNEAMLKAMPPDKLQSTWQTLLKQVGAYQKTLGTRVERQGQYEALISTLQFEKLALDMRVTMDVNTGQMAGLFFTPAQTAAQPTAIPYSPPAYVNAKSFAERDVTVGQGEWALPGILAMPSGDGPFPAIVLVHGSGPNDRDETIGPNKPFRDLAWGLASQGVAVLRYDKRTLTHGQKLATLGTLTVKEETIDDALAAAALLRQTAKINPDRVFVLGHSLGGMLAPRIGQADGKLAGLVILAGATTPLEDLMLIQTKYLAGLDGSISADDQQAIDELARQVDMVKKLTPASTEAVLGAPPAYWLDLRAYKPAELAKTLKQPMLILQGERDYQVPMSDFQIWKDALAGQKSVQFKSYAALNHLFIAGQGQPSPQEYEQVGHVDEAVINDIATWIKAQ